MLLKLIKYKLNYSQTLLFGGFSFIQTFIETSMPILQWLGAVLGVLVLLKKLFSKDAE